MAYMIQISEEKMDKLTEMCEKMLRYGGKMMRCLESLDEEDEEMGHRDYDEMDERDGGETGNRTGYRRRGYRRY